MQVECFTLEDPQRCRRYDALFESCPDAFIQQSTYWARAIEGLGPDVAHFLLLSDGGVDLAAMPVYLFRHDKGNVLTSVPQAGPLGGVFTVDTLFPEEKSKAYGLLIEHAKKLSLEHDCLSFSVISNPFNPNADLYRQFLDPTYTLENFTQQNDVHEIVDEKGNFLLPDLNRRSNLSRNLKKAMTAGFTLKDCDSLAELEAFHAVQCQRHAELGVAPLPFELLKRIHEVLVPIDKARILLVKRDDAIASGAIYLYHREVLDVLRLTVNSDFLAESPNFLNTRESLIWARRRGVKVYNWQSAPSRSGGVYRYKSQWGAKESTYCIFTKLFCEPSQIRDIGLESLKTDYALHFVVPYDVFSQGFDHNEFRKV